MKLRQIVWGVLLISQILIFVSASAKRTRKAKTKFSRRKIGGRGVKTIRVVDINSLCEHHETMFTESGDEVYNPKQDTEKLVCAKGSTCIRNICNCDDLEDGTITLASGVRKGHGYGFECKNIFGQKCKSDDDCYYNHPCVNKKCACPRDPEEECRTEKEIFWAQTF